MSQIEIFHIFEVGLRLNLGRGGWAHWALILKEVALQVIGARSYGRRQDASQKLLKVAESLGKICKCSAFWLKIISIRTQIHKITAFLSENIKVSCSIDQKFSVDS